MSLMTFRQELIHVFLVQINQKCFYLENVRDIMLDSGTTVALVPNKNLLYNIKDESNIKLLAAGQNEITVEGEGILKLKLNENISIEMKAMIVPSIKINIIPLASLYENNLHVDETCDNIISKNGEIITSIFEKEELWWISGNHIQLPTEEHKVYQTTKSKKYKVTLRELHRRLGHTNVRCVRETVKRGGIEDLSMSDVNWEGIDEFQCESCMKGKASWHPHIKDSRDQYNEKHGSFEYICCQLETYNILN